MEEIVLECDSGSKVQKIIATLSAAGIPFTRISRTSYLCLKIGTLRCYWGAQDALLAIRDIAERLRQERLKEISALLAVHIQSQST
jgi:hypothetical protein